MKLWSLFAVVLAVVAMFLGGGHAAPDPKLPVKQIGKAIKTGIGIAGAAGTAKEVWDHVRNRG